MKRAVIYARYSSERQTEQSIEGQLTVCKKFASDNDFVILDNYIDRATTGTNDNRPAFKQMLRDSAQKKWEYVIIYKNDRFARNRTESAINKKILRDNNVKVISASENIPETPEGIILESLLEGMAEYYSAELSQKVKRGMNESRKKRQFTGGFFLYGYDIVDKKYVINPQEAEIVKQIFEDYSNGRVVKEILAELNNKGLKNKYGKPFAKNSLYRMLRTEKYAGIVRYKDEIFTDTCPAIISPTLYEKVSLIIQANKRAPSRRKSYGNYILSGKLYCGECGGLMTGESGTSKMGHIYHYYKCFEKKIKRKCTFPSIPKDYIEDKVIDVCINVLNAGFIPTIIDTAFELRKEELENNAVVINLRTQLGEKQKAIKNIMSAIEAGVFTNTTKERLTELENDTESLKYSIAAEIENQTKCITKQDCSDFLNGFIKKQIKNDDFKNSIINLLIRKIVVFRDKIRITFNFSPGGGGGKQRDFDIDKQEIEEAQKEYNSGEASSNLFSLSPPSGTNPNTNIFIKKDYFGVWIEL